MVNSEIVNLQKSIVVAAKFQREIEQPRTPTVSGHITEISRRSGRNGVTGDLAEMVVLRRTEGEAVTILMADAADKDVAAAMLSMMILYGFRMAVGKKPGEILNEINTGMRLATVWSTTVHFATAVCAEYYPTSRRLTWAVAGHRPPLIFDETGQMTEISKNYGPPLNVEAWPTWGNGEEEIPIGGGFGLISDGIEEAPNKMTMEQYGVGLLAEVVKNNWTADLICPRITTAIKEWEGKTMFDDQTMIWIRMKK